MVEINATSRRAIPSMIPDDPIDMLIALEADHISIPPKVRRLPGQVIKRGGEYDFLEQISPKLLRGARAAGLISQSNPKSSSVGHNAIDVVHHTLSQNLPQVAEMNPSEFGAWWFRQIEIGLDRRKEVRQAGGLQAYQRRMEKREQAVRYADSKDSYFRKGEGYSDSLRARIISDDDFFGGDEFEYELTEKFKKGLKDYEEATREATETLFQQAEDLESGKIPQKLGSPLTFRMGGTQGETMVSAFDTSLKVGQPAFLVDIDETLLTGTKKAGRLESTLLKLKGERAVSSAEWTPWNEAAKRATRIDDTIRFVQNLQESGIQPVFMTARDEALRDYTTGRLKRLGLDPQHLYMRGLSDEQAALSPTKLKAGMLDEIGTRFNFVGAMDDSKDVVKMMFERGASVGIIPSKGGFDSMEESFARGLQAAGEVSEEAGQRMARSFEAIVSAGTGGQAPVSVIDDIRSAAEQVGQASPKKKTYNTLSKVLSDFELGKKVTRTFARRSIKLG